MNKDGNMTSGDQHPDLGAVHVTRKTGQEHFHLKGKTLPFNLLDFWQWYCSDLLSNTARGIIAEYLVTKALGSTDQPRLEWDAYDVLTEDSLKIEVKSGAYIQTWDQRRISDISFSIPATQAWDYSTSTFENERKRQADIYIFCVLHHKDQNTVDPLNLDQWSFYIVDSGMLYEKVGEQKSIKLTRLEKLGFTPISYDKILDSVQKITKD